MLNPAQLRQDYPGFASEARYSNVLVSYWLNVAGLLIPQSRWGCSAYPSPTPWPCSPINSSLLQLYDVGVELFAAHNLALEAVNVKEASNGIPPGGKIGPLSSKSVDKVSLSYDTGSGVELNAGHWNTTNYGTRFIRLARELGAGPLQLGTPGVGPPFSGPAWAGPPPFPGWFG